MNKYSYQILQWLGFFGSMLWAGLHFVLIGLPLPFVAKVFFGFVIAISIASGMMFLEDRRKFFIPVLIFYILDAALLFESRVAIAPVFNTKLPYTTDSIAALILDFIMIIISIAIILMAKTQKK